MYSVLVQVKIPGSNRIYWLPPSGAPYKKVIKDLVKMQGWIYEVKQPASK